MIQDIQNMLTLKTCLNLKNTLIWIQKSFIECECDSKYVSNQISQLHGLQTN